MLRRQGGDIGQPFQDAASRRALHARRDRATTGEPAKSECARHQASATPRQPLRDAALAGRKGLRKRRQCRSMTMPPPDVRRKSLSGARRRSAPGVGSAALAVRSAGSQSTQNLARFEYVFLCHQQIDVTDIAQGRILKSGEGQWDALEDPEIDLPARERDDSAVGDARCVGGRTAVFSACQARRAAAGSFRDVSPAKASRLRKNSGTTLWWWTISSR